MSEALFQEIRDLLIEIRDLLRSRPLYSEDQSSTIERVTSGHRETVWEKYLEEKNPKNDYEIIALVVDWLTRSGKNSVSKEEIIEFIRDHPDRISNTEKSKLSSAIDNTKNHDNYKYIDFVDKDKKTYCLSIKGRQLVKRLPERPNPNK